VPDPFCPEFITEKQYYADGEDEDYRIVYSLKLPDMLLHSLVGRFLRLEIEPLLHESCCAYRPNLGQAAAVAQIREIRAGEPAWVVKMDVKDFNGTADHDTLRGLLSSRLLPRLRSRQREIVIGTVEALFKLTEQNYGSAGRGLLVGSGVTPALTNLYLLPLDELLLKRGYRFVRYGDDLVVFCPEEHEAQDLMAELVDALAELKQKPSDSEVFEMKDYWTEGFARTYGIEDQEWEITTGQSAQERTSLKRKKTDIYSPGEPLDFVGFEFADGRVCIRQSTLNKMKMRIQKYTQRYRTMIKNRTARKDYTWGLIASDDTEDIAVVSIKYVQRSIQRINSLLGYRTPWPEGPPPYRVKVGFDPRWGFVPNLLKCTSYGEVAAQLKALDSYAYRRLKHLAHQSVDVARLSDSLDRRWYDWSGMNFRVMGLRTSKDVANRMPPDASGAAH
jgi:hypothetical protein